MNIEDALNEAERRGMERAAEICEEKEKWLGSYEDAYMSGWENAQEIQGDKIRKAAKELR